MLRRANERRYVNEIRNATQDPNLTGCAATAARRANQICKRTCCAMREAPSLDGSAAAKIGQSRSDSAAPRGSSALIQPILPTTGSRSTRVVGSVGVRCGNGCGAREQAMSQTVDDGDVGQQWHAIAAGRQAAHRWAPADGSANEPSNSPTVRAGASKTRIVGDALFMARQFYAVGSRRVR